MGMKWEKIKDKYHSNLILTMKWSLFTTAFIFIILSAFSFFTYKTSTNAIVEKEQAHLNRTLDQMVQRLARSSDELTIREAVYYLKETNPRLKDEGNAETIEANLIQLNTFIAELSQPELSVFIYNTEKKLVFETRREDFQYIGHNKREISQKILGDRAGFVATTSIYSNKSNKKIGYVQLFYDLTSVHQIEKEILRTNMFMVILAVILSLIIGFFLSSYFLRPLKQITQTINIIKADPQTDVRMPEMHTKDEFADLVEVFNDMMDRMQRFIVQQQQFVEDVSHELRTPVAIIEGHLKMLNRWGKEDPEILEESLEASLQEIIRMKSLVQEMLDLSRVEQVEFQHQNDISYAKEVIHQTYNNFQLLYEDFTFILDDDLSHEVPVGIYRNHFEQLLIILLDNAVKYSRNRKEIHISVSSSLSYLEIAIQDFVEGISEEDIDRIFHRFYRVDKARSRQKGGNGLGLSIAKELVENYGGSVQVESSIGKGSIFRVYLPIKEETSEENLEE